MAKKVYKNFNKDFFDNLKFQKFMKDNEVTVDDIADKTGITPDTIKRYINKIPSLQMRESTIRMIVAMAGANFDDFVIQQEKESIKEEPIVVNIDMAETNELLKDLISAVNKLGNLEMQNMEYLKELRNLMK